MATPPRTVSAGEAAAMLGVSTATLYAYVSRGLLRSEPGEGSTRARRYLLEDIAALQARKEYRREPAKAAESALGYGMPVLDSSLTLIDDGRLYYRGYDVPTLARERTFEEVAALLWTGSFGGDGLFAAPVAAAGLFLPLDLAGLDPGSPIERFQAALAAAGAGDLAAHRFTAAAVAATGVRILSLLTHVATGGSGGTAASSLAATLQGAWAPERPEAEGLISAALILCADHELNVSAFTARCVASAGSTPYAVVIAALSALQGYKHGGHTAHAAALLSAAAQGIRPALAGYLQGGDKLPGFGHPLYPDGDPRARCLLGLLEEAYPAAPEVRLANDVCAAVDEILGLRPTIDLALAALARGLDMPRHTPLAIFALGRTAGWIGHAIEQYALDQLIRPRARYIGPAPMDA
ncbi:MAG: citrate synthase family protein [Caldilineaceae bacterium]